MNSHENEAMFELLRMAISPSDSSQSFSKKLSVDEWARLHESALKQLLVGILYRAINRLPQDCRPSIDLIFQWASEAETIKGQNIQLNEEAARLTRLFTDCGRKSVVLKGPANARLYPDPYMRQAGDIDLWVEGDKKSVVDLVKSMGFEVNGDVFVDHHVHFEDHGVCVEIHYKVSSGNNNPFTNNRLQRYLEKEIEKAELVSEGFLAPTVKFNLVMQLAHIQRHFLDGGIGLKQLVDYYVLLQHSSDVERGDVAANLKKFGLWPVAGALMWILDQIFCLEKAKMLCAPDSRRGKKMLAEVLEGGNFGKAREAKAKNFLQAWLQKKKNVLCHFGFAPSEMLWHEILYWKRFVKSIPIRIRLRRVSIWNMGR